jgi:nucleoside recognition membrane protein YjiH
LLGGAIKRVTHIVIASVKAIVEWGGGLTNTLRVLAIAIALAFGPVLITMITTATAAMFYISNCYTCCYLALASIWVQLLRPQHLLLMISLDGLKEKIQSLAPG